MNVCVISYYKFPYGAAASNRIIAYSQGLVQGGACVKVLIALPFRYKVGEEYQERCGSYGGVEYEYTNGRYSSRNRLVRAISIISGYRYVSGLFKLFYSLLKRLLNKDIDRIIISHDNLVTLFIVSRLANAFSVKTVFIFDEYPESVRYNKNKVYVKAMETLYRIVLKKVDGYISISEMLSCYYNSIERKKTHIMSIVVDTTRFMVANKNADVDVVTNGYICYLGNMDITKDSVDVIVSAFAIVSKEKPSIELRLYGQADSTSLALARTIISKYGIQHKVRIMGSISYESVPEVLGNALILVSAQPNSTRVLGGLSTKIGEYIASGTPVVMTDVGENAKYLSKDQHAFFVRPNDVEEYAKTLLYVLDNYKEALKVSEAGRAHIYEKYSHTAAANGMLTFLRNMN